MGYQSTALGVALGYVLAGFLVNLSGDTIDHDRLGCDGGKPAILIHRSSGRAVKNQASRQNRAGPSPWSHDKPPRFGSVTGPGLSARGMDAAAGTEGLDALSGGLVLAKDLFPLSYWSSGSGHALLLHHDDGREA